MYSTVNKTRAETAVSVNQLQLAVIHYCNDFYNVPVIVKILPDWLFTSVRDSVWLDFFLMSFVKKETWAWKNSGREWDDYTVGIF